MKAILQFIMCFLSFFAMPSSLMAWQNDETEDPLTYYLSKFTTLKKGEKVYKVEFDANGDGINDIFLGDDTPDSRSTYSISFLGFLSQPGNKYVVAVGGPGGRIYSGDKIRLKRNSEGQLCFFSENLLGQEHEMVNAYLYCVKGLQFLRVPIRTLDLRNPDKWIEPIDNSEDYEWANNFVNQFDKEVQIETIDVDNHPALRERIGPFVIEKAYLENPYRISGPSIQFTDDMPADSKRVIKQLSRHEPAGQEIGFFSAEEQLMVLYDKEAYEFFKKLVHPLEAEVIYRPPNGKAGKDNSESNAAPVVDAKKPPANSNQPAVSKNDVNNTEANTSESDKKYGLILMLLAGAVLILMMIAFYRKSKKGV